MAQNAVLALCRRGHQGLLGKSRPNINHLPQNTNWCDAEQCVQLKSVGWVLQELGLSRITALSGHNYDNRTNRVLRSSCVGFACAVSVAHLSSRSYIATHLSDENRWVRSVVGSESNRFCHCMFSLEVTEQSCGARVKHGPVLNLECLDSRSRLYSGSQSNESPSPINSEPVTTHPIAEEEQHDTKGPGRSSQDSSLPANLRMPHNGISPNTLHAGHQEGCSSDAHQTASQHHPERVATFEQSVHCPGVALVQSS